MQLTPGYDVVAFTALIMAGLTWVIWGVRQIMKRIVVIYSWTIFLPMVYIFIFTFAFYAITNAYDDRVENLIRLTILVVGTYLVLRFVGRPVVYNARLQTLEKALERTCKNSDLIFKKSKGGQLGIRVEYHFEKEGVALRFHTKFSKEVLSHKYEIYMSFKPRLRAFRLENKVVRELKKELRKMPADEFYYWPVLVSVMGLIFTILIILLLF